MHFSEGSDVKTSPRMSIPLIKVNDAEHVVTSESDDVSSQTTESRDDEVVVIEGGACKNLLFYTYPFNK